MTRLTRMQHAEVINDPFVQDARRAVGEAVKRLCAATATAMTRRGITEHTPHVAPVRITLRPDDPNPWPGKKGVAEMLVRMGLEGRGHGLKTNAARHRALVAEACRRCGAVSPGQTRSVSVWTNRLTGYALTNCTRLMTAAGHRVPKAVTTVAGMFGIIEASQSDTSHAQAEGRTYGEGIHAVTFLSAHTMLYRGERFNLQWRHGGKNGGKACNPVDGSATAAGRLNGKPVRRGLRALLMEHQSITAGQWPAVRQVAALAAHDEGARTALARLQNLDTGI